MSFYTITFPSVNSCIVYRISFHFRLLASGQLRLSSNVPFFYYIHSVYRALVAMVVCPIDDYICSSLCVNMMINKMLCFL